MTAAPFRLSADAALLSPVQVGDTLATNRLFMAPLTRSRADADGTPSDLAAEYYAQRAAAVGRSFLANPDLIDRLVLGAELNEPDVSTFYASGPAGYVDYPTLSEVAG